MCSHKQLGAGETENLKVLYAEYCRNGGGLEDKQLDAVMSALPRLLSMLTPPPDAELREAVEAAEECIRVGGWGHLFNEDHLHIVIRALIRAVQAPRLTGEQEAVLRAAVCWGESRKHAGNPGYSVGAAEKLLERALHEGGLVTRKNRAAFGLGEVWE